MDLEMADPFSIAKRMLARAKANPRTGCVVKVGWDGKRISASEAASAKIRLSYPHETVQVDKDTPVNVIAEELQEAMHRQHPLIRTALLKGPPKGCDKARHEWNPRR